MLSVLYAECHIKPFMVSVIMLNVVMLSVLELGYDYGDASYNQSTLFIGETTQGPYSQNFIFFVT